jgi:HK97 family phage major capsid protein
MDGMNGGGAFAPAQGRYGRKDAGGAGGASAEKDFSEATRQLKTATDEVRRFAEQANTEIKNLGKLTTDTAAKADDALLKLGEVNARLAEAEQKMSRRGGADGAVEQKSMGQRVVEDERFKGGQLTGASRSSLRVAMSRKDIMNVTATVGAGTSPGNSLTPADRVSGLVAPPTRRMTIRDLLLPGETESNAIEYPQEVGFTNNAAPVAEGATKPKSDITFNLKNAPVRTIAHIFKASRQILDDAPQLRTYIDGRARYGLELKEEQQLLSGSGAVTTGATAIDKLRIALLQVTLAEYPSSGFVLNPIDWANIEMLKDTQGRYIIGDPQGTIAPRLWGLPVVATQAMAQNNFLTGAFNIAAQIFDRMEIEVLLSTENADDFERNLVTIRAEERLALAVYRPEAFVAGTIVTA